MKEMEYIRFLKIPVVLADDIYKNYHYLIISYGSHPCAYVRIPKEHKYYKQEYDDIPIEVHGGLTYSGTRWNDAYWIGWDYAHYQDYTPALYEALKNTKQAKQLKKWTTEEIFEDVKSVINQLIKVEK